MLKYDTILWDLDGTLLDFKRMERYALEKCLGSVGVVMTQERYALYSEINEGYWKRLERGEVEIKVLLPGRFEQFFRQIGVEGMDPDEMQKRYERELGENTCRMEDSYEVVSKIKEMGLKQHIVTNGTVATQQAKMKNSGFDKLIDRVFISEAIGAEKPQREFFDSVFGELTDLKKDRTLLVGDSLTSDMRGAYNAGVDACFYNPKRKDRQTGEGDPVRVAYEIASLHDIIGILEQGDGWRLSGSF